MIIEYYSGETNRSVIFRHIYYKRDKMLIFLSVHRVIEDRVANYDVRNGRSGTGCSSGYHAALLPSSAGAGANQPGRAYYALQVTGR